MNLISAIVRAVSFRTLAIVAAVLTTSSANTLIDFSWSMLGLFVFWLIVSMCWARIARCTDNSGSKSSGAVSSLACKNFSANAPRKTVAYRPCL